MGVCAGTKPLTTPPPIEEIKEAVPEPVVAQIEEKAAVVIAPGPEILEDAQNTENQAKEELAKAEVVVEEKKEEVEVLIEKEEVVKEEVEEATEEIQELKKE